METTTAIPEKKGEEKALLLGRGKELRVEELGEGGGVNIDGW